jgi:hypothetical protein
MIFMESSGNYSNVVSKPALSQAEVLTHINVTGSSTMKDPEDIEKFFKLAEHIRAGNISITLLLHPICSISDTCVGNRNTKPVLAGKVSSSQAAGSLDFPSSSEYSRCLSNVAGHIFKHISQPPMLVEGLL